MTVCRNFIYYYSKVEIMKFEKRDLVCSNDNKEAMYCIFMKKFENNKLH